MFMLNVNLHRKWSHFEPWNTTYHSIVTQALVACLWAAVLSTFRPSFVDCKANVSSHSENLYANSHSFSIVI